MLARIQGVLTELYDVEVGASVDDFVCGEALARATVGEAVARGEVLVVAEEPDGISVGLYVDPDALAALGDSGDPARQEGRPFEAYCLATEGVSHFVYLMFRAENEHPVSQLELELQGEVDKYATALLAGNGMALIRQRDGASPDAEPPAPELRARSRALRKRLFDAARFRDPPGTDAGDRYRMASRVASRFAERLEREHLARGELRGVERALRRFYRMGIREKVEAAGGTGL